MITLGILIRNSTGYTGYFEVVTSYIEEFEIKLAIIINIRSLMLSFTKDSERFASFCTRNIPTCTRNIPTCTRRQVVPWTLVVNRIRNLTKISRFVISRSEFALMRILSQYDETAIVLLPSWSIRWRRNVSVNFRAVSP